MKSLLFTLITLFTFSFSSNAQVDQSPEVGVIEHLNQKIPLDLKFVNDKSDTVTLGQIIDKPTILSFVYFDCPGLCSPLLDGVGTVISKTDLTLGKDYQLITISFNYRDTPEKAKEKKNRFVEKYSKDKGEGWIFLTTDSVTIKKITNSTGFMTKAVGLDFVHPSAIIAISPEGKITRYLYGLTFNPTDFKMAVIEANKEQARPTIQRIMQVCYSYDQDSQRYALDVTKIAGILIVFFLLVFAIAFLLKPKKKQKQ